jgi:outer membrane usher protein FimD/PapC
VWVDFSVLRERSAVLILTGPDGQVLPAGSRVHVSPGAMSAAVGLRGEVYVQNLPARAQLQVDTLVLGLAQHCLIEVDAPITDDPQPRLGPYVCALRSGP